MPIESWQSPVLDAQGMRSVDAWAIEQQGVPSLELMERAGLGLAEHAAGLAPEGRIACVCGSGNNGGDGIVAARHLRTWGHAVDVLLLAPPERLAEDAAANLERLEGGFELIAPGRVREALEGCALVVDAVLGTGFSGEPRDPAAAAIEAINSIASHGARVAAADIPSGVDASTGAIAGPAVKADVTVTFHAMKLGHVVAPGKLAAGRIETVEIGVPPGAPVEPAAGAVGEAVLELLPRRERGSNKFSSGSLAVVGGSPGLTGAVALCARAAARAGAGYATAVVPAALEPILEAKLTEVMTRGAGDEGQRRLDSSTLDAVLSACERASAVALGCGLGGAGDADVDGLVAGLVERVTVPLVVDADGLGALGRLGRAPARAAPLVLTPHAGELARLLGSTSEEVSARRLEAAREAADRYGAHVMLKGDDTIVAAPAVEGRVGVVDVHCPALATAGTGDVLTGVVGALLARGVDPFAAACAAVFAHGRAGRDAARAVGAAEGVIAGDVIEALPRALAAGAGDRAR